MPMYSVVTFKSKHPDYSFLRECFLHYIYQKSLHESMVYISNIKITLDLLIYTSFVSVTSENKKQKLKNDTKTDVT